MHNQHHVQEIGAELTHRIQELHEAHPEYSDDTLESVASLYRVLSHFLAGSRAPIDGHHRALGERLVTALLGYLYESQGNVSFQPAEDCLAALSIVFHHCMTATDQAHEPRPFTGDGAAVAGVASLPKPEELEN